MQNPPIVSFYSPQELETFAEVFLQKYASPIQIPIDIELIIEKNIGISILDCELELNYGLHGYLALSLKTIYIERFIMDSDNHEKRYRFILVEEIGHLILHKNLFKGVKTPEDYINALDQISEAEHKRMDMDAKRLGEAILMPAESFRKAALDVAMSSSRRTMPELRKIVGEFFNVSEIAVFYRFSHLGLAKQIKLSEF